MCFQTTVLPERMTHSFLLSVSWAQWMNDSFISQIFIECLLSTKHWYTHLECITEQNYGRLYSPNIAAPVYSIPHVFLQCDVLHQECRVSDFSRRYAVYLLGLGYKWWYNFWLIFSLWNIHLRNPEPISERSDYALRPPYQRVHVE